MRILPTKAYIKNIKTNEIIIIHATTDHPESQDGWEVWVDDDGKYYGPVGARIDGFEFVAEVK